MLLCLGPRLQARRLRRSRARGVQRSAAARSEERVRAGQPAEAARRAASVDRGVRHAAAARRSSPTIDARPQSQAILAFLENEIGLEAMRRKDYAEAVRRFEAAIDLDARAVPAYLNLGDVRVARGQRARGGRDLGEADRGRARPRLPRLRSARSAGDPHRQSPERFTRLCRRLIDDNPQDWRARLALSRHLAASGQPREALDLLFAALVQNPHALGIHQAIWRALGQLHHPPALVDRYSELTRARRVLPRSARLHALPLPQHRAALAVPALPRLEHVRRGADRAGAGSDRGGSLSRKHVAQPFGLPRGRSAGPRACATSGRSTQTPFADGDRYLPPAWRCPRTFRRW